MTYQWIKNRGLNVHQVFNFLKRVHICIDTHPTAPNTIKISRVIRVGVGKYNFDRFPVAPQSVKRVIEGFFAVGMIKAHVYNGSFVVA